MYKLNLITVLITNVWSLEFVKTALLQLTEYDNDFNGRNGYEYVCQEAIDAGYESNAEYFADKYIKNIIEGDYDIYDIQKLVGEYLYDWMGCDGYYQKYAFDLTEANADSCVISVSYTTE